MIPAALFMRCCRYADLHQLIVIEMLQHTRDKVTESIVTDQRLPGKDLLFHAAKESLAVFPFRGQSRFGMPLILLPFRIHAGILLPFPWAHRR